MELCEKYNRNFSPYVLRLGSRVKIGDTITLISTINIRHDFKAESKSQVRRGQIFVKTMYTRFQVMSLRVVEEQTGIRHGAVVYNDRYIKILG